MKTLKLFVVILLMAFLVGCKTTTPAQPILPDDLPPPVLQGEDNSDIIILLGQDVRWRLWALEVRWILGYITDEEYDERSERLLSLLE